MSTVQEQPGTRESGPPTGRPRPASTGMPPVATSEPKSHDRVAVSTPLRSGLVDAWRRHPLARPCTAYILSRVAVLFAALGTKWLAPKLHLLTALTAGWDGKWYQLIAQHGYPGRIVNEGHGSRWAFFPGWPLAIRATVDVTHLSYTQATLFLSFTFGLTSAIAVWLAVREVFGKVIADRAVLLYVFFPASFVLSLGYSEGLFITACGVCLYALSRRYWLTAALAAVVGGLTKDFGIVLVACVVVAAGHAFLRTRMARPSRQSSWRRSGSGSGFGSRGPPLGRRSPSYRPSGSGGTVTSSGLPRRSWPSSTYSPTPTHSNRVRW